MASTLNASMEVNARMGGSKFAANKLSLDNSPKKGIR